MPYYNHFQTFVRSFYLKNVYRDVLRNWEGYGFLYIFTVLILIWIPLSFIHSNQISNYFNENSTYIVPGTNQNYNSIIQIIAGQMPEMRVSDGEISIDKEMPYIITSTEGDPLIIIDTTGKTRSIKDSKAFLLFTRNQIIFKNERGHEEAVAIPKFTNDSLNGATLLKLSERIWMLPWIIYPLNIIQDFFSLAIRAFAIAMIGIIMCSTLNMQIPFKDLVRLTAIASTPAIVVKSINTVMEKSIFAYPEVIQIILTMFYLYAAIEANKSKEFNDEKMWE